MELLGEKFFGLRSFAQLLMDVIKRSGEVFALPDLISFVR